MALTLIGQGTSLEINLLRDVDPLYPAGTRYELRLFLTVPLLDADMLAIQTSWASIGVPFWDNISQAANIAFIRIEQTAAKNVFTLLTGSWPFVSTEFTSYQVYADIASTGAWYVPLVPVALVTALYLLFFWKKG